MPEVGLVSLARHSSSVTGGETCSRRSATLVYPYAYTWDVNGNPSGAGITVGPGNRLLARYYGDTLTYDADGNYTKHRQYHWNALGQLTSVGTSMASFGYDAWGRRVRVGSGGYATRFLYDGAQALVELDTLGHPTAEYSFYPGLDQAIAVFCSPSSSKCLSSTSRSHPYTGASTQWGDATWPGIHRGARRTPPRIGINPCTISIADSVQFHFGYDRVFGTVHTAAKSIPWVGAGLDLGEAIHSFVSVIAR
jgi:hypothetical protein